MHGAQTRKEYDACCSKLRQGGEFDRLSRDAGTLPVTVAVC